MFKTFPIVLDITKHQLNDMFQVNSNDLNTVRLNLSIKSGLEIFDLTGKIVRIAIKKPDGFIAFQTGGVTDPSNGLCEFILDRQAYLVEGKHEAEVMIYQDDSTVVVTERFYYKVNRAIVNDKALKSTNHLPAINQAIIAGEQLKDIDIPEFVEAANGAYETIEEAETQGLYAKVQGDYAKQEADKAATRITELNGVDAVQFKGKQDQFELKLEGITSASEMQSFIANKGQANEDWQPAIQKAIDDAFAAGGGTIRLPKRIYQTYSMITIKPTVELVLDTGATIKPMVNIDVIRINKNGKLRGGKIDVGGLGATFTKSCILLNGDEKFSTANHETFYGFIEIKGSSLSLSGNAIRYYASGNGHNICWVHASHVNVTYFDKGIFLDCVNGGSGNQWVNGNQFDMIGISTCKYPIYLNGSYGLPNETAGNTFDNFQIQSSASTQRLLYVSSTHNRFSGMFWDYNIMPSSIKMEFTTSSANNTVDTNLDRNYTNTVLDMGAKNIITNGNNSVLTSNLPPAVTTSSTFGGYQDDFLAFSDRRFTVTQTSGPAISGGLISRMFNLIGDESATWDATQATSANPVVLEIDFLGSIGYLSNIGISSGPWSEQPKNIKIEIYKAGSWVLLTDSKNNTNQHFICTLYQTSVEKLRITFSESFDTIGNKIRINKIFAYSATNGGQSWLAKNGGKIFGDIEYNASTNGTILKSPDGSRFRLTIGNDGAITTTKL